jgi:mRNA interferase HigB
MFNIIARRTLNAYCERYPEAADALRKWYVELVNADFSTFNQLKAVYGHASLVADNRVVFNIMGNKYRLVVRVNFSYKSMMIKWFGTHTEYDQIDVVSVQPGF